MHADHEHVFVVFEGNRPRAVYKDSAPAKVLIDRWAEGNPEQEYTVEEWPVGIPTTRFNVMVVASA